MLDLPQMKAADLLTRKSIVAEHLSSEIPEVLSAYKIREFDASRFIDDLQAWIVEAGWK